MKERKRKEKKPALRELDLGRKHGQNLNETSEDGVAYHYCSPGVP